MADIMKNYKRLKPEILEYEKEGDRLVKGVSKKGPLYREDLRQALRNYKNAQGIVKRGYTHISGSLDWGQDDKEPREDRKRISEKINSLEKTLVKSSPKKIMVFASVAILCFVAALTFVSFNITGYAIGGVDTGATRWIGIITFAVGLIFAYFYFQSKKKTEK